MKKKLSAPFLELSFAAGIMVILTLPLLVNAQDHKEFKVNINNSDTIVNGKNIKELPAAERKDAVKKLNELNDHISITMKDGSDDVVVLNQKAGKNNVYLYRNGAMAGNIAPMAKAYSLTIDSTDNGMTVMSNIGKDEPISMPAMRLRSSYNAAEGHNLGALFSYSGRSRRNTQSFSYSNTDKDGISTHINFSIGDASAETTKKISGSEKAALTIQDLNMVPSFSTGKTTLSFSLANKAAADVQFKDSEGTLLWEGKTSGNDFSKSFILPKNGVYYLQVKQAGKLALRKITKEE